MVKKAVKSRRYDRHYSDTGLTIYLVHLLGNKSGKIRWSRATLANACTRILTVCFGLFRLVVKVFVFAVRLPLC